MVEGVDDVYYSNKIVVQEIKDAAKRESGDSTTSGNDALVFTVVRIKLVVIFQSTSLMQLRLLQTGLMTVRRLLR